MKKIISALVAFVMMIGGIFASAPVMAADGDTAVILQGCENVDNGHGEGIACILRLVVNILNVGVGVLGVLGIVIVGIQYLTSGGNEEQMRKSKRRLFEIVIGLIAYVLIYAALTWLLPGFGNATTS